MDNDDIEDLESYEDPCWASNAEGCDRAAAGVIDLIGAIPTDMNERLQSQASRLATPGYEMVSSAGGGWNSVNSVKGSAKDGQAKATGVEKTYRSAEEGKLNIGFSFPPFSFGPRNPKRTTGPVNRIFAPRKGGTHLSGSTKPRTNKRKTKPIPTFTTFNKRLFSTGTSLFPSPGEPQTKKERLQAGRHRRRRTFWR